MSQPIRILHASSISPRPRTAFDSSTEFSSEFSNSLSLSFRSPTFSPFNMSWVCARDIRGIGGAITATCALKQEGSLQEEQHHHDCPVSVQLQPICSETQFDRVIAEAQQLEVVVIVLWMARWCRKCIYLKPKLEKLAADYYPRLRFYSVDVNTVSHKLVARAGVTKMPSIQLWKDSKIQAEVLGGHNKAYLIINEVKEMIENECNI